MADSRAALMAHRLVEHSAVNWAVSTVVTLADETVDRKALLTAALSDVMRADSWGNLTAAPMGALMVDNWVVWRDGKTVDWKAARTAAWRDELTAELLAELRAGNWGCWLAAWMALTKAEHSAANWVVMMAVWRADGRVVHWVSR